VLQKYLAKNTDVFWKVGKPQYQEANNVICSANSPAILKKAARKIGYFPHGYTPQKQRNIITYPILPGLPYHYEASRLSFLFDPSFSLSQ
jgi:hypothetical protein